ncbi:MAG: putative rane protein, partial [Caballeronia sp.]|nr:putative rane protein [Caballeronia sp.]
MTKSMSTNARHGLNALHPGNAPRSYRRSVSAGVIAALLLSASLMAMTASAQDDNAGSGPSQSKLSPADQQFVQDAGTAGATEIAASKLAMTNSSDEEVK